MRKLKRHNSVNKNFNAKLLWKRTAAFYASSLCEEIICYSNYDKENSIAGISISFMLLTIYKEIQIGSGKLLNQYKQKTDKIRNMNVFEKVSEIPEISRKFTSLHYAEAMQHNLVLKSYTHSLE